MITIKDLEKAYLNHTLTDLLKEISDENLAELDYLILCDDMIGIRIDIYDAIYNEIQYRQSDKLMSKKSSK